MRVTNKRTLLLLCILVLFSVHFVWRSNIEQAISGIHGMRSKFPNAGVKISGLQTEQYMSDGTKRSSLSNTKKQNSEQIGNVPRAEMGSVSKNISTQRLPTTPGGHKHLKDTPTRVLSPCTSNQRQRNVKEMCPVFRDKIQSSMAKDTPENPSFYRRLLVDDKHRVIYCRSPKTGSTSWKVLMALHSDSNLNQTRAELSRNPYQVHLLTWMSRHGLVDMATLPMEEIKWRLESYFKIVFVRNPFEKMISGYRDKLTFDQTYARFYSKIMRSVFPEYVSPEGLWNLPFSAFIRILSGTNMTNDQLTALAGFRNDPHWKRQIDVCHPCHINYDYIGKVETIATDQTSILPIYGAKSLPALNVNTANEHVQVSDPFLLKLNNSFASTQELREVLSNAPELVWRNLVDIYQMDFDILGYTADRSEGSICKISVDNVTCC